MRAYHGISVNFHYHGDLSEVIVDDKNGNEIRVYGEDIKGLVAEYVRSELIGYIENMDTEELLLKGFLKINKG